MDLVEVVLDELELLKVLVLDIGFVGDAMVLVIIFGPKVVVEAIIGLAMDVATITREVFVVEEVDVVGIGEIAVGENIVDIVDDVCVNNEEKVDVFVVL